MNISQHVSTKFLPYGRQHIDEQDIQAVLAVLQSDWLTQGPAVPSFENALARYIGTPHVIACSSGTAALHLAMLALDIGPGDIVVTSAVSFAASANCALYVGAQVLFADIDPATGLMAIDSLQQLLEKDRNRRIKAVVPVHLAGQPVDLKQVFECAKAHGASVVDDACHALGGTLFDGEKMWKIGGNPYADISVFSFHPVKHIATGEGGALAVRDAQHAKRIAELRTHGITRETFTNSAEAYDGEGKPNPWYYEMQELGFNYRMTDLQAALGESQLGKLDWSIARRQHIATCYQRLLSERFPDNRVGPLVQNGHGSNAWHLYVVQIDFDACKTSRASVMNCLRTDGIGTQVHYIPIPMQPYYRRLGFDPAAYPQAMQYYRRALSLPMYPDLTDSDIERVVDSLAYALTE